MVLLQIDADALRLPGFDSHSVWYLVYFLFFVIAGLVFMQWRLRKRNTRNALSNRFMQILMRRNLTKGQLAALQSFFRSLHENVQNEIMLSQKSLEHHLHQYIERHTELTANDRVEIYDKLLMTRQPQIEIRGAGDLQAGELCAVDAGKSSWLATVMKTKDNQVLLTSHERQNPPVGAGHVYAYRPGLGGFLLSGHITKVNGGSLIFRHDGPIDFRGDQHLMATVAVAVHLRRWPHEEMKLEGKAADGEDAGIDAFSGFTDRLSDRALLVRFSPSIPDWMLARQDYWEMELELPEKPLVCRVKAARYQKTDLCFIRPADLESAERNRLYKFIAAHDPVREHF